MKRVVLIVVAVLLGLWGMQLVFGGLLGSLFGGLTGLVALPVGGGLVVAAVMILRSQMQGGQSAEETEAQRVQLRTGLRILLIMLGVIVGLAGLFLSLCGVLMGNSSGTGGAGWFVAIGVVVVIVAIILIVKGAKMR